MLSSRFFVLPYHIGEFSAFLTTSPDWNRTSDIRRLGRWAGTCASRRLHIGCTGPIRRRCQEGREFSNVVRQHEKLTGKHRPGIEGRTSSKRCRVASSNRPCSSLSDGDGGDVGAYRQSVDGSHVTICSPSGCG